MLVRRAHLLGLIALAFAGAPAALSAQDRETRHESLPARDTRDSADARERAVKRQRQGAGLRLGSWQVQGLAQVSGATTSTLPAFEGYWQRGLDRHVVLETSAGLWSRTQHASSASGNESVGSYVIPLLTSIKLYPATEPGQALEPFIIGGVGFTLGVDDRNTAAGGLLGGSSGGGTMMIPGLGLKVGTGVEYHLGSAFGVVVQGGYQYVRFFQDVGSDRTYKGIQLMSGMTYHFQF